MREIFKFSNPVRVYRIFLFLLTIFLIIKKRDRFLFFKPLTPEKLYLYITKLGASFIKLAQVLATRADFFSKEYLEKLKSLHDEIPKMSKSEFETIYSRAFKDRDIFLEFQDEPIASASIGQVHIAKLKDSTKVAVKLRRFDIQRQVKSDILILNFFNGLFKPLFSHYTKNSIESLIKEFSSMILEEVDLNVERANLDKFSNIYRSSGVIFPKPFKEFSSEDALVMSFEEGFRFDDVKSIKKAGVDFHKIIEKLVIFYTEQMLIRGYFHADPHPGNLLVDRAGNLILLDFGMVKKIPNPTRIAIIELVKSANEQDFELFISSSKRLGTIAYEAPEGELAEFTEKMFEIFSNDNLDAQSMQQLAFDILSRTKNLPFKLPQEAIYILRVSSIVEGLGTTYIENFNGVKDILPILQKNIPKALGAKDGFLELFQDELSSIPLTIRHIKNIINKASEGEMRVHLSNFQLEWIAKETKEYINSFTLGFIFIFGSIFTLMLNREDFEILATTLFFIGVFKLIYR